MSIPKRQRIPGIDHAFFPDVAVRAVRRGTLAVRMGDGAGAGLRTDRTGTGVGLHNSGGKQRRGKNYVCPAGFPIMTDTHSPDDAARESSFREVVLPEIEVLLRVALTIVSNKSDAETWRIQRYLDADPAARLTPGVVSRLGDHLATCDRCTQWAAEHCALHRALSLWSGGAAVDPGSVERIRDFLLTHNDEDTA